MDVVKYRRFDAPLHAGAFVVAIAVKLVRLARIEAVQRGAVGVAR